jgi:hypothetical protein
MQALSEYNAYMRRSVPSQYTIRGVPTAIALKLRERSRLEGKSLNKVTIETLMRGLGMGSEKIVYSDLDALAGTWIEDPEFDAAILEMDRIDEEIWK